MTRMMDDDARLLRELRMCVSQKRKHYWAAKRGFSVKASSPRVAGKMMQKVQGINKHDKVPKSKIKLAPVSILKGEEP